jgi:hypothetical protein
MNSYVITRRILVSDYVQVKNHGLIGLHALALFNESKRLVGKAKDL